MAWMDILECADGSYYVGSTRNLERRISEHQQGLGAKYTSKRLPVIWFMAKNTIALQTLVPEKNKCGVGVEPNVKR